MTTIAELRRSYHEKIGTQIVRFSVKHGRRYPNFADVSSRSSVLISNEIAKALQFKGQKRKGFSGQTAGTLFEKITCEFVEEAFRALGHLRPGKWLYNTSQTQISGFVQYRHLKALDALVSADQALSAAIGPGYIVTPDIVVTRKGVTQQDVNTTGEVLNEEKVASLTPFLVANQQSPLPFLHASISCKWTIRSDRSQNTRTEALNLIRNRKGALPHIVAVTAEPLPMRIASLALGTGDLDCVYHFALDELKKACEIIDGGEDQLDMLTTMIEGDRLRDISDLPFDLAV